jgi:hypothetical protein
MNSSTHSRTVASFPRPAPPVRIDVKCSGDPFEIGRRQGVALREKLGLIPAMLHQLEAFRLPKPGWMPFPIYRWLAVRKGARMLLEPLRQQQPEMLKRLEGIAVGAGVKLSLLMLCNVLEPLLASVRGRYVTPPLGGCSAVAVRGARSATGEPMIARNFDYLPLLQPLYSLRATRPAGGFRSLDFIAAPLAGAIDGINEHGLCITYDYAFVVDEPPKPAVPISMAISLALERCRTVAEAANLIATRPRWGGGLLMLADATGDIASLELSNSRAQLRRPAAGEDLVFHSNAFCTAPMREVQVPDDAIFTSLVPTALRNTCVLESSRVRNARFEELLARYSQFTAHDLAVVMSDHGPDGQQSHLSPCVHSDYWFTTATMQFFPVSRRLRIDYASACQANYQDFVVGQ